jgi:cold shock CspA family protein
MTQGYVTSFDARRGTGFVQQQNGSRIPFTLRDDESRSLRAGDRVAYTVTGGMAGVKAQLIRPTP